MRWMTRRKSVFQTQQEGYMYKVKAARTACTRLCKLKPHKLSARRRGMDTQSHTLPSKQLLSVGPGKSPHSSGRPHIQEHRYGSTNCVLYGFKNETGKNTELGELGRGCGSGKS